MIVDSLQLLVQYVVRHPFRSLATVLRGLALALVDLAVNVYRRPVFLGAAILGLTGSGLGLIIGSRAMTGWWQSTLLGFGTGLVLTGTLELGLIVGLMKQIIEPDSEPWSKPRKSRRDVLIVTKAQTVAQPASPGMLATPREVAAILRELASSLEGGAAES